MKATIAFCPIVGFDDEGLPVYATAKYLIPPGHAARRFRHHTEQATRPLAEVERIRHLDYAESFRHALAESGRCVLCGRELRAPAGDGIGPECRRLERKAAQKRNNPTDIS